MLEKIKNLGKDELVRGSFILIIMLIVFNLLNYAFQISMAKMLTPGDYGIVATLMSIIYILAIPLDAIQTVIARYTTKLNEKKENGKIKDMLYKSVKKGLGIAAIAFVIFLPVSLLLSTVLRIDFWLLAITGLFLFYVFTIPVLRGILQGKKRFTALGFSLVIESVIKLILAIFFVWIGLKVYGAMTGVIIAFIAIFFIVLPWVKEIYKVKRKSENFDGLYKYNLSILISVSVIILLYSVDIILARIFFSDEITGLYAFVSLIAKTIFFVNSAIGKAMFPITSEKFDSGKETLSLLKKSTILVTIICFAALVAFLAAPELIIKILSLGSDKYLPAANVLFILGLAFSAMSYSNILIMYKLSTNRLKNAWGLLIFAVLEIILLYIFKSSLVTFSLAILSVNLLMLLYLLVKK